MWGSRQPAPSTSQALSAAAAIRGRPAGNAGGLGRLGGDLPEDPPGGTSSRQQLRVDRHRLPLPVARPGPAQPLVVERHVAHLAAHRIDEAPDQAVGEKAREKEVFVGLRSQISRLVALRIQLASASAWKWATVSAHPHRAGRPGPMPRPPAAAPRCAAGRARRWPAAAARRRASTLIIVARWVVSDTAATASRGAPVLAPTSRGTPRQTTATWRRGPARPSPGWSEK